MGELNWLSAAKLSRGFARKKFSPVEVAKACLGQIAKHDHAINATCRVEEKAALAQAEASAARWKKGRPLGPLDGVPVLIKDLLLVKGWPTLRGSKTVSRDQAWDQDAPSVARLREAGCVFLGATTTPEFGWKGVTDGPLTGITRNPWDTDLTPGGSSGGSAAGLAAGYAPLALGTDGGGSIRIPATWCGLYGLKPQRGRVLAAGPGKLKDDGGRLTLNVKVGDEVLYGKYSGSEVEVDGRELKILREGDILAKVVK